jgi:hypothetical protein
MLDREARSKGSVLFYALCRLMSHLALLKHLLASDQKGNTDLRNRSGLVHRLISATLKFGLGLRSPILDVFMNVAYNHPPKSQPQSILPAAIAAAESQESNVAHT